MWTFEQWRDQFLGNESSLINEGAAILRAHEQNVRAIVKGASRKCSISIYEQYDEDKDEYPILPGLAANCPPHLVSDVGYELATESGTFGLLWHINKDGKCLCSLRSNGDYDVSTIAKAFGGGGHRNAAGFEIDIQILLGWIK